VIDNRWTTLKIGSDLRKHCLSSMDMIGLLRTSCGLAADSRVHSGPLSQQEQPLTAQFQPKRRPHETQGQSPKPRLMKQRQIQRGLTPAGPRSGLQPETDLPKKASTRTPMPIGRQIDGLAQVAPAREGNRTHHPCLRQEPGRARPRRPQPTSRRRALPVGVQFTRQFTRRPRLLRLPPRPTGHPPSGPTRTRQPADGHPPWLPAARNHLRPDHRMARYDQPNRPPGRLDELQPWGVLAA